MAKEKNNNLKIGEDIIAALSVQAAESVEGLHVLTSDGKKASIRKKACRCISSRRIRFRSTYS